MASKLISTTLYETDAANLKGGKWTEAEDVWIDATHMGCTNKVSRALWPTAVGQLQEWPPMVGTRMVVRLTAAATMHRGIKSLLESSDL